MSDDTLLQFGGARREETPPVPVAPRATSCPACGSRFSPDGRFCPFDGTPLVPATSRDPRSDALLGSVIDGRYEVLAVIGEGGMGTVYEVRHRALGKRFALKALRKDLALDGEIAARFIQEARTAAAVSHPGLVEITDFGQLESGQVYFVMELLVGQSLAALLRTVGPLPAERGLWIVRQLVHALKAAHDASIVHRDLKPDNIHVGQGDGGADVVKIVDFGLAKVMGSSKLTAAGVVFGTPHYMSPEQAAGDPVDHRADIYALGIVMYEMFTGKVPFEADSYMGVLTKHMYMTPAPPSDLRPELKALGAFEDVVLRCLQKRPQARYDDLAALLADLEQLAPAPVTALQPRARASLLAGELASPAKPAFVAAPGFRYWPALVVALAFMAGVALVVALRRGPAKVRAEPARASISAGAAVAPAPPSAPLRPMAASPEPETKPEPEPETSTSAKPLLSADAALHVPARKPAPSGVRQAPTPAPKGTGSSGKRRVGGATVGGEIVDPWAH